MNLKTLPLANRTQAVSRLLCPVAVQIADALKESALLVSDSETLFQGMQLPQQMVDAFSERARNERLQLVNKHARDWQGLWQRTVTDARARWGDDAVDAVLKQLTPP